jgi:hypothetical protein
MKTYFTNKTKYNIIDKINETRKRMEENPSMKIESSIDFDTQDIWLVINHKITTKWFVNPEKEGKITIRKWVAMIDYVLALFFLIIDCFLFYDFSQKGFDANNIIFLALVVLFEALLYYYFFVIKPRRKIKKFLKKYIDKELKAK